MRPREKPIRFGVLLPTSRGEYWMHEHRDAVLAERREDGVREPPPGWDYDSLDQATAAARRMLKGHDLAMVEICG